MSNEDINLMTVSAVVVSDKMEKACVVMIERCVNHPKYTKKMKRKKKLIVRADDSVKQGDTVLISPCRPISKRIHFQVSKVI